MNVSTQLSIIIPCYNEEDGLPEFFRRFQPVRQSLSRTFTIDVLFVDDGSTDRTYSILSDNYDGQQDVNILRHPENLGLGAAFRTGIEAARGDYIVSLDSDFTYPPSELEPLIALLAGGADVVTGSPYHPDGGVEGVPGWRLLISKTLSFVYRMLLKSNVYTYTSLFRGYRRKVIDNAPLISDDFSGVAEILVWAIMAGHNVVELPTVLHTRQYGQSKIKVGRTILKHLRLIGEIITGRFAKRHGLV